MKNYFYTELLLLFRRPQAWLYPLCFFSIVICLFPLAFTPDPAFLQKYIIGCIWIAALLTSLLSVENLFFADLEDGYLEQMLLGNTPLSAIIFFKMSAHWLMAELPLIILSPVFGLMFNLSGSVMLLLFISLLIGTPILLLVSALAASLTIGLRQHGTLLGLLILPLTTPVMIFGVTMSQQYQAGFSIAAPLALLTALCLIAMILMPWGIAAALRVGVDE